MPGLDRSGPEGRGSMTGRGMGSCNSNKENSGSIAADENPSGRRFPGKGRRFGRGLRKGRG